MSNFFLCPCCEQCDHMYAAENEFNCLAGHKTWKVMYDHHGRGGIRYESPTEVCRDFTVKDYMVDELERHGIEVDE